MSKGYDQITQDVKMMNQFHKLVLRNVKTSRVFRLSEFVSSTFCRGLKIFSNP